MSRLTTGGTPPEQPLRRSIAGRLVFWFLVIALIPCAILTAITARIASAALEGSVRANLVQIAASKAGEIEAYAAERVRDGMALARGPTFIRSLRSLAAISGAATDGERQRLAAAGQEFADYFTYVAKAFGYAQLLLIDDSGRVVFAIDESIPLGTPLLAGGLASSELATGFDRARTLLQADLGGFQTYGRAAQPLAFVTCPILQRISASSGKNRSTREPNLMKPNSSPCWREDPLSTYHLILLAKAPAI
jgi:methyl-accepting chemotaxis protein WspA